MEDSKKKPIMIGVIIVCLVIAGLVTFARRGGSGSGIEGIPDDEMTWVKCGNKSCNAEYEMGKKQYLKAMQERFNPMARTAPPLTCETCGKESIFQAMKCANPACGAIFFRDSVPNDHFDRCTKCGQSETEEIRERRKREMAGGQ
ncbi:MAG: hypothetical protein ACYSUX_06650 [Planctomycetota bacterium]|jgi:hypothetical protein